MAFRAVILLALPCVQADESCLQEETTLLQIGGTAAMRRIAKHIDEQPTHYYAVNSWPEGAWGAYDSDARGSTIEKCFLKEQTEDADGSGYLFTSCCTSEGVGMSRDCGSTMNTNWDTAVAQCASQGGRLCTADEAMSQVTVSQGCDVDGPSSATGADLNRLWTSTACTPRFYGQTADGCPSGNSNGADLSDDTHEWAVHQAASDFSGDLIATEAHRHPDTTASVRCCSLDGSTCSTNLANGGCHAGKTLAEAHEICAANDMRLCAQHEMADNVCCGTGCWFNHHAVWVTPHFYGQTADGCPSDNSNGADLSDDTHEWAVHQAASDFSGDLIATEAQSHSGTTASVRCCSMDGSSCSTDSLAGGCQAGKTLAEAHEICAANDMRLCTEPEMADNVCCGTGCWFNHHAVWVTPTFKFLAGVNVYDMA